MKGACCSHGRVSPALTHLAHPSRPLPFRSHCLSHTRAHKRFNVLVRSYTIRRAELADASALAEVDAACAPDGSAQWSAASFAADIDNPSATVLVAEVRATRLTAAVQNTRRAYGHAANSTSCVRRSRTPAPYRSWASDARVSWRARLSCRTWPS